MIDFVMEKIMPVFMCILMIFIIILIPLIFIGGFIQANKEECIKEKCIREDVNCDGEVTIKDLLIVQKYILEKDNNG